MEAYPLVASLALVDFELFFICSGRVQGVQSDEVQDEPFNSHSNAYVIEFTVGLLEVGWFAPHAAAAAVAHVA